MFFGDSEGLKTRGILQAETRRLKEARHVIGRQQLSQYSK